MNWILTVIGALILASNIVLLFVFYNFVKYLCNIPYADYIKQLSDQIGAQVKTSIMGTISGVSRQIDALDKEALSSSLNATSPGLNGLISLVPGLQKKVLKSPGLAQLAMSLFAHKQGNGGAPDISQSQVSDFKSRLNRYGG